MMGIRRVVTGQPRQGRSVISSDGDVPTVFGSDGGSMVYEIWKTLSAPAQLTAGLEEPAAGPFQLQPPASGAVFRIAVIPPDSVMAAAEANPVLDQLGEAHSGRGHAAQFHRTNSMDFAVVLEGPLTLMVDDDETELQTGDVVIQRGANHAWSNRGERPCRMAFVMLDARYS